MFRLIRLVLLVLVLASLLAPAAFARTSASRPIPARGEGFSFVWDWMASLFVPAVHDAKGPGKGIVTKEGSSMDPNGSLNSAIISPNSTTDEGSQMDPNGFK